MFRKVHEVVMRLHAAVHPNTLAIAANLIWLCPSQGKANTPMPCGSSALLGTKHERLTGRERDYLGLQRCYHHDHFLSLFKLFPPRGRVVAQHSDDAQFGRGIPNCSSSNP